ncbi:putative nucleic acid-binding Zn-ribbon protein [Paenibacillus sp. PvR133]|uniref:DUF3732 domain-containing protein n=1 Tax=Paenibacillus sp. PvR133 TaxID=2806598 RepID=UPI001AE36F5C|nr:DUF3732 domain-containing protein [Paenibacillus sp. PvR133]MBP1177638.1 putative nucleic acid-binding Zn-ribbon protein [Paenibacillus sp. PvR133]
MKSYINAIVIFNKDGEKRFVDFQEGVNIITGDSKTGKSALVEIIDYCLCSSRCTIPKGKITDFGSIFCLIFIVNDRTLIIGRERWETGGKMYFSIEKNSIQAEDINIEYFDSRQKHNVKDVQYLIEKQLGMEVDNIETNEGQKPKKASLRNMVSYMFQHQNLMASKFALFYRFSDFYKRQDVIQQFPIFAGYIGQEYYTKTIQLNEYKKILRKLQKREKENASIDKKIREELIAIFKDYYALINVPFINNKSIVDLIKLSRNLPEIDLSKFSSKDIVDRYNTLSQEIENLRQRESELNLKINELKDANHVGYKYIETLNELRQKTSISEPLKDNYTCPLCGGNCQSINHLNNELIEASNWLDNEINFTNTYSNSFLEDIRKLENERLKVESLIKKVYGQMKNIERRYLNSDTFNKLQDKISFAKAKIKLYVDTISGEIIGNVNEEIIEITKKINELDGEIGVFNVESKIANAKKELEATMNKLAKTLDFEEEFKPVNLDIDIETFDVCHKKNNDKIYLSEMGSGANWVSCHIALFLSFLRLFTEQKENSPMPLLLFFDQPSQVYFPQGIKNSSEHENESSKQTDIEAVNNMYNTIFNEIKDIKKDTGILPQIIIVDHVDGEELEIKDLFREYTRRNWRKGETTEALI